MKGRPWTPEEDALLGALPNKRIAEITGRSIAAIWSRTWLLRHPEESRAMHRAYQQANPEKNREKSRRWYQANPGKSAKASRAWRQANPGKSAKASRAWRQANPEKVKAQRRRRWHNHKEYLVNQSREWRQANPEKTRELSRKSYYRCQQARLEEDILKLTTIAIPE